jgi:hypothetical protein
LKSFVALYSYTTLLASVMEHEFWKGTKQSSKQGENLFRTDTDLHCNRGPDGFRVKIQHLFSFKYAHPNIKNSNLGYEQFYSNDFKTFNNLNNVPIRKTHLDVQQEEVHYTPRGDPSNRSMRVNKGKRGSQYLTLGGSQEAIIVTERRNSQTGSNARIDAPFAGSSRHTMGKGDPSATRRKAPAS